MLKKILSYSLMMVVALAPLNANAKRGFGGTYDVMEENGTLTPHCLADGQLYLLTVQEATTNIQFSSVWPELYAALAQIPSSQWSQYAVHIMRVSGTQMVNGVCVSTGEEHYLLKGVFKKQR